MTIKDDALYRFYLMFYDVDGKKRHIFSTIVYTLIHTTMHSKLG
jgi:hypothetical protein